MSGKCPVGIYGCVSLFTNVFEYSPNTRCIVFPMLDFDRLNRISFGPKESEISRLGESGWSTYVQEQLSPGPEPEALEKLLHEKRYRWDTDYEQEADDPRPLRYYHQKGAQTCVELWNYRIPKKEMRSPFHETVITTWLKAMHSPWQLREIMVEFWHNHFNVSVDVKDLVAINLASYDKDTIRPHAFGNFRVFLEAVAKSPAMLFYLDNASSNIGPANENYARELFELHTLGKPHYLNHLYNEWDKVPGATRGKAEGYIDEDVYEASRAFTGWTVGLPSLSQDERFSVPLSGDFYYLDNWHDHYQKRILGVEFPSHQGPMQDGLQVLDLLAAHEGTARFVCGKICKWLVSDDPPKSIVKKAVRTWMKNLESPNQIALTLETILLSAEFEAGLGSKIKRPNHMIISYARMLDATLTPVAPLYSWCRKMGFDQFSPPFPTGIPDGAAYWTSSDAVLKRWQTFPKLEEHNHPDDFFHYTILEKIPEEIASLDELLDFLAACLRIGPLEVEIKEELGTIFKEDLDHDSITQLRIKDPNTLEKRSRKMLRLMAMSPEFQKR